MTTIGTDKHPLDELLCGGFKIDWDDRYHELNPLELRLQYKANTDPLVLKTGNAVIRGLPNDLYHAERDHVSSSSLKVFGKNPTKYHRLYVGKVGEDEFEEDEDDKYKSFGTLVHSIIIEPERLGDFYETFTIGPDGTEWNARKQLHRTWKDVMQRQAGKLYFHQQEFDQAMACAMEAMSNKTAMDLIGGTEERHREISLLCCDRENMIPLKAKYDLLLMYEGRPTIVDIKTTAKDASPEGFAVTMARLGYDISAALYCLVFKIVTGVMPRFLWVVIEKDKDGDNQCIVHEMSNEDMMLAIDEVRSCLQDLTLAHMAQFQSTYYNKINRVAIPSWRFRRHRQ